MFQPAKNLSKFVAKCVPKHQDARMISSMALEKLKSEPGLTEKHLCGPGPTNMHPEVVRAMAWPNRGHMHPDFFDIMDDVRIGLRYLFDTQNALTLAVSGPGHSAMEASFVNLVEPGDKAVILRNGFWSLRAAMTARNAGADVVEVHAPMGSTFSLEQIEEALITHKPKVLFVVHGESSTGVVQCMDGFADLCHAHNCLVIVDAVASIGGAPFHMDKWDIDCVYAGSQKAVGGPAGIAPISFNDRAWHKIANRQSPFRSLMVDMTQLGNYWGCFAERRQYHHTAPIQLVYGLRQALSMIAREGLENVWQRHADNAQLFYNGLHKLGLQPFIANQTDRLPPITTICIPHGTDWQQLIADMWRLHGIEIWGGMGETAGKIWRVGLMGHNSRPEMVAMVLTAMQDCLAQQQEIGEQIMATQRHATS